MNLTMLFPVQVGWTYGRKMLLRYIRANYNLQIGEKRLGMLLAKRHPIAHIMRIQVRFTCFGGKVLFQKLWKR